MTDLQMMLLDPDKFSFDDEEDRTMKLMRKSELIKYLFDRANAMIRIGKELNEAGMVDMYWPFLESANQTVAAMSSLNTLTGDMGYDLW